MRFLRLAPITYLLQIYEQFQGKTAVANVGLSNRVNLQATKLFIVTSATKGGGYQPPRFSVRFKILYREIQPLIQHWLLRKTVYLNIIYVIATRNYEFFTTGIFSVINELLRYSTVTT